MSADREVIREFLVSLGFSIDESGARKFISSVLGVSKVATGATAAIAGVAVASEVMVQRFARNMESMFYASRRTKSTVENLQALEFGAEQIGIKGEEARAVLENISRAVRLNPGLEGLLRSFSIDPNQQGTKLLTDLVGKLSKMPHYVGAQFAELFGMDEKTFLMMKDELPKMLAAEEKRREMNRAAGVDVEKAAAASREYSNTLRELWARVEVLGNSIAIRLLPVFQEFMGVVNEALKDIQDFASADLNTQEWHAQLQSITQDFSKLNEQFELGEHAKAFFWFIKEALKELGHLILGVTGLITAMLSGNRGKAQSVFKDIFKGLFPDWLGAPSWEQGSGVDSPTQMPPRSAPSASSSKLPRGLRNNNPGNLRQWGSAQVVDGFAKFQNMAEGLSAMAGNLMNYSKRGWDTAESIATHWTATSSDWPAYINAIKGQAGGGKINLQDPNAMASVMKAIIAQENGYQPIGSDQILAAASGRTGGSTRGATTLTNKVDIHVNGSNASETASAVANAQDRVWGNLVRNSLPAVQ